MFFPQDIARTQFFVVESFDTDAQEGIRDDGGLVGMEVDAHVDAEEPIETVCPEDQLPDLDGYYPLAKVKQQ